MGKFKDLQVGDKVYLHGRHNNRYLTVQKRGRQYITFDSPCPTRALIGSDIVEEPGYGSIGVLYETREEYLLCVERTKERHSLLNKLVDCLRYQSLDTLKAIDEVIEQAKDGKA